MSKMTISARRFVLASSTALMALTTPQAAFAAEQPPSAGSEGEILVTAQKRSERLQDVPASIGVISGTKLEDLNVKSTIDYASYIPGFNVSGNGAPGRTTVTLRGIATVGSTPTVATYIDDVPIGSSGGKAQQQNTILDLMPYDLERVEVLRGPQGTLYGASAMGGLVKYVLVAPDPDKFSGKVGASVSTIDGAGDVGYGFRAAVNVPLVNGKLALRASAYDEQTPGYINNINYANSLGNGGNFGTNTNDSNSVSQKGGRVSLLWLPAEGVSVTLGGLWQRTKADDLGNVSFRGVTSATESSGAKFYSAYTPVGDNGSATGTLSPFVKNIDLYTATVKADLGFADLISASSYSHTKTINAFDDSITFGVYYPVFSAGVVPPGLGVAINTFTLDKYTEEVRLSSHSGGRIEWLLGAFYTHEKSGAEQIIQPMTYAGAIIPYFVSNPFYHTIYPSTYKELSGFGDLTFHLTDKLDITGGGRYYHNSQSFTQTNIGFLAGNSTAGSASKGDKFTWMVSPSYHITRDTMVYARVATGFRAGGPNLTRALSTPGEASYKSDSLINYETGVKAYLLHHRLSVDLTAFYIDWTNVQVFLLSPTTGFSYLGNAGKAISKGFELESVFSPIQGLRLGLNASYTNAHIASAPPAAQTINHFVLGAQLPDIPKWSGSVTADYSFPLVGNWFGNVGTGLRYVGRENNNTITTTAYNSVLSGYTVLDLNAGVSKGQWMLRLFARNLTNTRAYTGQFVNYAGASPVQIDKTLLQPRTIGLVVDRSF